MAKASILVVDDEPCVLQIVARVLEGAGYEVAAASGPKEALEMLSTRGSFELVVSDVVMPEMCGPQLASEIRLRSPSSRILFMSGWVPLEQLPSGFPFLGKPFSSRDLLSAVEKAVQAPASVPQESRGVGD